MKKRRIATMVAAVAVVAAIGVGATLAYFTDKEDLSNVVTMKHVDIELSENEVKYDPETGEYVQDDSKEAITAGGLTFEDVLPGQTVPKNPTVTVEEGSADCYVRVKVAVVTAADSKITAAQVEALTASLKDQILMNTKWSYNEADGYFYYADEMTAGGEAVIFQTVTIPASWDNATAEETFQITVDAEAIQSKYVDEVVTKTGEAVTGWSLTAEDIQSYPVQ
jgi:predicted ribosomally synthesized peptide with SipW-like signal peptide